MTAGPFSLGVTILGTDTAAGKTTFACALLRLARRYGLDPLPHKPVETGWLPTRTDASRPSSDSSRLLLASSAAISLSDVCPFRFPDPVAPALAATNAGVTLRAADLASTARRLATRGDFLVVETAGGLLSPYGPGFTGADLAAELALPIVLVAPNRLGTINHSTLALAELRRRNLPPAAFILVDTSPDPTPDHDHNARLIAEQTGVAALLTLPFVPDPDPDHLADALAAQIATRDLFARLGVSRG